MSDDDLDIRHGGLVSVDTGSLRAAARDLVAVASCGDETARALERATGELAVVPRSWHSSVDVGRCGADAERWAGDVRDLARDLESTAAGYELVELRAAWIAADRAGDGRRVHSLERRIGDLSRTAWGLSLGRDLVFARLAFDETRWRERASRDLRDQAARGGLPFPPGGALAGWLTVASLQMAVALTGATLTTAPRGELPPVTVRAVTTGSVAPPGGLAAAVARIPGGGDERVRIERYDLASGTEWVVYVAGTQSGSFGGIDPFDMESNAQLFDGQTASSYAGVLRAMDDAGVAPDDPVHLVGHSQGAMIAGAVAVAGGHAVRTLVTVGSPVTPEVGPETLTIDLRHSDDPVAALAGQGTATGNGDPRSVVVERLADPAAGFRDLSAPAHALTSYVDTAEMLDRSSDPRAGPIRDVWRRLADAERSVVTGYSVRRPSGPNESVSPVGGGAG